MKLPTLDEMRRLNIAAKWQNHRRAMGDVADEIEPNPHLAGSFAAEVWDLGGPDLVDEFRRRNLPRIEAVLTHHFNS